MTTYFAAPDGHGEPTLWVRGWEDEPRPVIRQCDLGDMEHHWDELVARVIAGNPDVAPIMEWHVHQWSGAEGRGLRCKECGDRVWIGIDPPARNLIVRHP